MICDEALCEKHKRQHSDDEQCCVCAWPELSVFNQQTIGQLQHMANERKAEIGPRNSAAVNSFPHKQIEQNGQNELEQKQINKQSARARERAILPKEAENSTHCE